MWLTEWWHKIWCHRLKWSQDMLRRHLNSLTKCMRINWNQTRSYLSAFSLCVSLAPLEQDKHIHHQTIGDGLETDIQVWKAVISGSMVDAHQILDKLPWTRCSLMDSHHQQQCNRQVFELFQQMQKSLENDMVMFMIPLCLCMPHSSTRGEAISCSCWKGRTWIRDFFRKCLNMYSRCVKC